VHLLVDKLKCFYENARCYNKIYTKYSCSSPGEPKISPPQLAESQREVTSVAHPIPVFSLTPQYINFQNQNSSSADISHLRKLRSSQPDIPKEAWFEKRGVMGLRMA